MCGIIYGKRFDDKPASKLINKQYRRQKTRGSDGFGYVSITPNKAYINRDTEEKGIMSKLNEARAKEILFHHRLPTSTANIKEAAHPITVDNKALTHKYYVVHNGVLSNHRELKPIHEQLGYKYTTEIKHYKTVGTKTYHNKTEFNDSEALAIEVARFVEGLSSSIDTKGSIAFIALQTDKKGVPLALYFGRNNGNPLNMEINDNFMLLSSEGIGQPIATDTLYKYNYSTLKILTQNTKIGDYYSYTYTSKDNHDDDVLENIYKFDDDWYWTTAYMYDDSELDSFQQFDRLTYDNLDEQWYAINFLLKDPDVMPLYITQLKKLKEKVEDAILRMEIDQDDIQYAHSRSGQIPEYVEEPYQQLKITDY